MKTWKFVQTQDWLFSSKLKACCRISQRDISMVSRKVSIINKCFSIILKYKRSRLQMRVCCHTYVQERLMSLHASVRCVGIVIQSLSLQGGGSHKQNRSFQFPSNQLLPCSDRTYVTVSDKQWAITPTKNAPPLHTSRMRQTSFRLLTRLSAPTRLSVSQ